MAIHEIDLKTTLGGEVSAVYGKFEPRIDCAARALAREDEKFISAVEWRGSVGVHYRKRARAVISALAEYDNGNQSGGLSA